MVPTRALIPLLVLAAISFGQAGKRQKEKEELVAYSLSEIDGYLQIFKDTYRNKSAPEDDATAVLEELLKAYKYLESKGDERSKDESKMMEKLVSYVAKGLKARKRPLVTLMCAEVLGQMGDPKGAKPLQQWMDRVVLDSKSANPNWVEYGFRSMAAIGSEDSATIDLMLTYATGKHRDLIVASHALKAVGDWKRLKGKNRKEFFGKIQMYLLSLWSGFHSGDKKRWGTYEKRYDQVKKEGLDTLQRLAGAAAPFADPTKSQEWWKDNKRSKWEDYVAPQYRAAKKT